VKIVNFVKQFSVGTVYRAELDKAYKIESAGTNSATTASVVVEGKPCLYTNSTLSPQTQTTSNLLGPAALGNLYIVVPPGKTLEFTGAAGSTFVLAGKLALLGVGESLPGDWALRFAEQSSRFLSFVEGSYNHGAGNAWAADYEANIIQFTCPTGEEWTFAHFLGFTIANLSVTFAPGQFGIRLYIDDSPLDTVETMMGKHGLDAYYLPMPPDGATHMEAFTLANMPITLSPGRTLRITAKNISGVSLTPTTGNALIVTVRLVGIRKYVTAATY
jgi:hypothetical protein